MDQLIELATPKGSSFVKPSSTVPIVKSVLEPIVLDAKKKNRVEIHKSQVENPVVRKGPSKEEYQRNHIEHGGIIDYIPTDLFDGEDSEFRSRKIAEKYGY